MLRNYFSHRHNANSWYFQAILTIFGNNRDLGNSGNYVYKSRPKILKLFSEDLEMEFHVQEKYIFELVKNGGSFNL